MRIDSLDKQIIRELQKNARISNLELAKCVNLSPNPCARRVKQLEDAGVISGYTSIINPEKIGLTLTALISVTMTKHTATQLAHFENAISALEEVVDYYVITGQESDFLLRVLVRDMQHYEQFLLKKLTNIEGVSAVHSSFVLRKSLDQYAARNLRGN